jgi:hypothetical protein
MGTYRIHRTFSSSRWLLLWLLLGSTLNLAAQSSGTGRQSKPQGSPSPQRAPSSPPEEAVSAFIGYVSNGSFVFPDIATSPGPLTTGGKFKLFVNQSISPPYIFVAASGAAFDQARDVPKDLGQGWGAYGSRFGASMARSSSSSFFESFVLASLLHQDPRFFPQSKPTFWGSLRYSTQRVVITRNDAGKNVFNTSGLLGSLASEGLAAAYLPPSEQTVGKTLTRFAADLGWRVGGNMFKNYWPTFFRNMGLNRLKVIPDPNAPQGSRK